MAHTYLGADSPSVLEQYLYVIPIIVLCLATVLAVVRNRLSRPQPEHIDAVKPFRQHKHHDPLPILTQVQKLNQSLLPTHHNKRRLIILGDVHGCIDELHALLKHVSFTPTHDHLILAGDLINKGPSSSAVLTLVRSLNASCVRGNHEDKILRARAALFPPPRSQGASYTDTESNTQPSPPAESGEGKRADDLARSLTQDEIEYIQTWPLILDLGALGTLGYPHAAVVHAGLVPGIPLAEQTPFAVMNMRAIKVHKTRRHGKHGKKKDRDGHGERDEETYTPSEDRDEGEKWHEVWAATQERLRHAERMLVVYGHDAKQGLVEREYSVGLDSACVRGERLSALVVEAGGMRVESVRARRDYTADGK